MQFDSWTAFWHMGGYGFFVWLAFAVSLLAMIGLVVESLWARKSLIQQIDANRARKKRIENKRQNETMSGDEKLTVKEG